MPHSPLFKSLFRSLRPTSTRREDEQNTFDRRQLLKAGGATVAALAVSGCGPTEPTEVSSAGNSLKAVNADIGIVGAGIAGLACAYELQRAKVNATIYEAGTRVGGRIFSMGGKFSSLGLDWMGQTLERGGELIDTPHKAMLGYAQELGLQLEDISKPKRDTFYLFSGQRITEASLVAEFRALVDDWQDDLRRIGAPTASNYTPFEQQIDQMSLAEWLASRGAGRNLTQLLQVAYCIEYGLEIDRISCLAFALFAKASRQAKLRLWGNFSDERYHVIGGNQQIPVGLAARLAKPIQFGKRLLAVDRRSDGKVVLTFNDSGRTVTTAHDAVVLAIPFHLLRGVKMGATLQLPEWKTRAITEALCGDNAKLMVGFKGQPWVEQGSNGAAYSDLPNLQTTWETDPALATSTHAILTDYTGGALARSLSTSRTQIHAQDFLKNLEQVYPGSAARARRDASGKIVCHLEQWTANPLSQGAYTANAPGYFTRIAGYEALPVRNLYFAGEATDSFYSWQGFMEGGALTGKRAAAEIQRDFV